MNNTTTVVSPYQERETERDTELCHVAMAYEDRALCGADVSGVPWCNCSEGCCTYGNLCVVCEDLEMVYYLHPGLDPEGTG